MPTPSIASILGIRADKAEAADVLVCSGATSRELVLVMVVMKPTELDDDPGGMVTVVPMIEEDADVVDDVDEDEEVEFEFEFEAEVEEEVAAEVEGAAVVASWMLSSAD